MALQCEAFSGIAIASSSELCAESLSMMQLRELMEERARLQTENKNFHSQVESLQERASEVTALRSEVSMPTSDIYI